MMGPRGSYGSRLCHVKCCERVGSRGGWRSGWTRLRRCPFPGAVGASLRPSRGVCAGPDALGCSGGSRGDDGVWQRQSLRLAGRSRAGAARAQAAPRALPWKRLGFCGFVNAVTAPPALPAVREGKEPTLSYTGATSVLTALMQLDAILAL